MAARILLVDDDEALVKALSMVLESAGYSVDTAANGTEGLRRAKKAAPDLAVLDVMMDSLSEGIDLARQFRAQPELADVKLLMLTSVSQKVGFDVGSSQGDDYLPVDVFVEKPVDPDQFLREVKALLGDKAS